MSSNERSVLVGKLHVAATYLNLHDCHVMGEACRKAAELLAVETEAPRSFQDRVFDWARDCFGEKDTIDPLMRTDRFLEEALEMGQACGCDEERAIRILRYVYGRPRGEVEQEAGGTMVSFAVLCQAFGIGMNRCAEAELTRVLGKTEHIRARHAAKPDFAVKSALETEAPRMPGVGMTDYWRCPCCDNYYTGERLVCPVSGDSRPALKSSGEVQS